MVELIKEISEVNAISGNEYKLREYILKFAENVSVDTMGNITVFKKGTSKEDKKLVVVTHTDECGLIVTDITDDGFIKFECVGNVELRSLISKKVIIADKVNGVIGMKAIHLQKKDERETVKKAKELFIDIGAKDKKEAQKYVKKGDYISFDTKFSKTQNTLKGKALDRICVAPLLELIKITPEYDTYFVFTVQKEVGMRGAMICASKLNPDFVVIADTVESADMFGCKDNDIQARLGGGVLIQYADKYSISDRDLLNSVVKIANENQIPYQQAGLIRGFSDMGEVITSYGGVKGVTLSVPVRYTHTPVQIVNQKDVQALFDLIKAILKGKHL